MKKLFTILAIAMCSTLAMAQTNQYFWAGGQLLMGQSISEIDSITFSPDIQMDTLRLLLPKQAQSFIVYNTITKYIRDTIYIGKDGPIVISGDQGALKGKFKISDGKHVYISRGNLQYQAITNLWKFAEEQYEIIGDTLGNTGIGPAQSAWIDLFGFGTSNASAMAYTFAMSSTSDSYPWDATIEGTKNDWGINNPIVNGGNVAGLWRTMSSSEWGDLFRNNHSCPATICGVCGRILFPEDFDMPSGMSTLPSAQNYTTYQYDAAQWKQLEEAGAAFFPAAGQRVTTKVSDVNVAGYYWSTTGHSYGSKNAYYYKITETGCSGLGINKYYGFSVRLIKNAD